MSLSTVPTVADIGLALGPVGESAAPLPGWLRLLLETARKASGVPSVIVLPDTRLAAEVTAILCARSASADAGRSPNETLEGISSGGRVMILPEEGVYEFRGVDDTGFWLHPQDVRNERNPSKFWVPLKEAHRVVRTRRKRPFGRANRHEWRTLTPTVWDRFAGCDFRGNAGLVQPSVIYIGARSDLALALETTGFADAPQGRTRAVQNGLPWGRVDDDGNLELLHPENASGEPILAVARDHISALKLGLKRPAQSLVFVSAKPEDALANRTSVERIAERHHCLIVAPGRLREGFLPRRADGWRIVELSGSAALEATATNLRSLDRVSAASRWMERAPEFTARTCAELDEAWSQLDAFSREAGDHMEEDDDVSAAAGLLRQAFFDAAEWLDAPDNDDLKGLSDIGDELDDLRPRIRSVAGEVAASAARGVMVALDAFACSTGVRAITPKGEGLLDLSASVSPDALSRAVIVAGHRKSAVAATAFLKALGAPMSCVTPAELARLEDVNSVHALSLMHRDAFAKFVDPWPGPEVNFMGYRHEIATYRKRLRLRQRSIERLRPDEPTLEAMTWLRGIEFPTSQTPPQQVLDQAPVIDTVTPVRHRPNRNQLTRPGEMTLPARLCRFAGRSWMAITDDHALARLQTGRDGKTSISTADGRDLESGDLVLIREGSEKDIVREMAERLTGPDRYNTLRQRAAHWSARLRQSRWDVGELRDRLAEEGLERGPATIRYWISDKGPIGPSHPEVSLPAIASALGEDPAGRQWKECLDAIREVRSAHVNAGFQLTKVLLKECGESILEHSDHETAFELSVGTVWLMEIDQLESAREPWSYTQINRIHWDSESWRKRMLRKAVRQDDNLDELLEQLLPELSEDAKT